MNQGGREYCGTCPFKGKIKSPIVLGYAPRVEAANDSLTPPYSVHVLPETVRAFVEEGARAMATDPAMIAAHVLALAGGVLGRKTRIVLKAGSWIELPILWVVMVAATGSTKSPALSAAKRGVVALQREANIADDRLFDDYAMAFAQWKSSKPGARGAAPVPPLFHHFFTSDSTPEALAPMLLASPGVTIVSDEFAGWMKGFDAYKSGKGKERQMHLESWNGDPLKIDCKGQKSVQVEHPVICIVGGIQPDILRELSGEFIRDDGFASRILWSYPTHTPARWTHDDISPATNDAYEFLFEDLANLHGSFSFDEGAWRVWEPGTPTTLKRLSARSA